MQRNILIQRFYAHPIERVWQALTDPQALAAWYADNNFQPVVGHRFEFRTAPGPTFDGRLTCEVVAVEPPHRLAYTFIGGAMKRDTVVAWTLTPEGSGTRLQLEHTGFIGFHAILISHILGRGWLNFLQSLPTVLDHLAKQAMKEQEK